MKFTVHFMECEIDGLPQTEARAYLLGKRQEYTRWLSYGAVSDKKQKRIDKTFEYLLHKYTTPTKEMPSDQAAERHTQVISRIDKVGASIESVVDYTDRKEREDDARQKREANVRAAVDKKCFTSKQGKPLTAKDLSSAKQAAELIPGKRYDMIVDCIEAVKKAR